MNCICCLFPVKIANKLTKYCISKTQIYSNEILSITLLFLVLSNVSKAQAYFSFSVDSLNRTYSGTGSYKDNNFKLYNSTGLTKNYNWLRTNLCPLLTGWEVIVCDCDACYSGSTYSKSGGNIGDSCSVSLSYYFSPTAALGVHSTLFEMYDPTDSMNSTTSAVFIINNGCSPLNTNEHFLSAVWIYPIPCLDQLYISFSPNRYTRMSVCDVFGKELKHQSIHSDEEEVELSMEHFASGLYLIRLFDQDVTNVLVRKIQKL
ncbi:hypothetical protein EMGBS15_01850 [Filimonas sp.]|nr:hypothetical protein EMGBS15_01850 [Filimonas sp.]